MKPDNRNLIIASNIYRASAFVSLVAYFLANPRPGVFAELAILVLTILIARLIRQGYKWTRWFLLGLWVLFLPLYIYELIHSNINVVSELPSMVVSILQLVSLVYLFLPSEETEQETLSELS